MAQSTPNKPLKSASTPKKPAAPMSARRKRVLIVSLASVGVLVLIVGTAWFVLNRTGRLDGGGRLTVSKDFGGEPQKAATGTVAPGGAVGEERTYTVKPGENLWSIASKGDLVGSAWEWRTILVQNRDKIQYAFLSEEDGGWKVMVEEGQQLKVKSDGSPELPGGNVAAEKLYAVQVLTVPDTRLDRAVGIVHRLLADGHFAYLYRTEAEGKRWYRIRVGFYGTKEEAMQAGEGILAQYSGKKLFREYWVMRPSELELQGGHLDYGVQQARPWVVELPQRDSHHDALEDLRKVASESEFAYIAQKRAGDATPPHYLYRTRIGFFASESQAKEFIAAHKGAADVLSSGEVVRVENLREALPGQNLKLRKPAQG